jgi:hypothetical protein
LKSAAFGLDDKLLMKEKRRQAAALHTPQIFVSVASKGLIVCVSGLESTLAGISTSVDSKGT